MRIGFECGIEELQNEPQWAFFWEEGLRISIPWFSRHYIVVDTETGGLNGKLEVSYTTETRRTRINLYFVLSLGLFRWTRM